MSINKLVHKSKRIRQKKKGSTLLEIVISIAIMAILIIPVGNLILSSVKMNRLSEDKQQGQAILQQAVEKLKECDGFANNQYFQLQDGMWLKLIANSEGFTVSHTNGKNKYQITGAIRKNTEIQSTDFYSTEVDGVISHSGTGTKLESSSNTITIAKAIAKQPSGNSSSASEAIIELKDDIITITREARSNTGSIENTTVNSIKSVNNSILLITKSDMNNKFKLTLRNTTSDVLTVYLYTVGKQSEVNDIVLRETQGNVKLLTGIYEIGSSNQNAVYEVDLKINKNGKEIETLKTNIIK